MIVGRANRDHLLASVELQKSRKRTGVAKYRRMHNLTAIQPFHGFFIEGRPELREWMGLNRNASLGVNVIDYIRRASPGCNWSFNTNRNQVKRYGTNFLTDDDRRTA